MFFYVLVFPDGCAGLRVPAKDSDAEPDRASLWYIYCLCNPQHKADLVNKGTWPSEPVSQILLKLTHLARLGVARTGQIWAVANSDRRRQLEGHPPIFEAY